MDTGLGSKAYSIIEQGKIGLILSTKPADRRALIEEAAGITRYRVRRRQTALKLEAAQQNLLRVNDIIHEVEKQLDNLKRQASKARRYRALREEMQGVERILFGLRYLALAESARGLDEGWRSRARASRRPPSRSRPRRRVPRRAATSSIRRRRVSRRPARISPRRRWRWTATSEGAATARSRRARPRLAPIRRARRRASWRHAWLPFSTSWGRAKARRRTFVMSWPQPRKRRAAPKRPFRPASRRLAESEAALDAARDEQVTTMGRIAALQNARESASNAAERAGADLLKLASESQELERERGQLEEARPGGVGPRARGRGAGRGAGAGAGTAPWPRPPRPASVPHLSGARRTSWRASATAWPAASPRSRRWSPRIRLSTRACAPC